MSSQQGRRRGAGGGPLNQLYREAVPRMIEVKFSANGKFAPGNVPPVNPAHKGRPQESVRVRAPSVHHAVHRSSEF